MFCQVNPFSFTVAYKPAPLSPAAQKLCQYLGIALQHSISVFKTRKNDEEKQTVTSQKSLSLSKQAICEEKTQKTDVLSQVPQEKLKEKPSNSQESEEKNEQQNLQIKPKETPVRSKKFKRRIIRKANKVKTPPIVKKQTKTLRKEFIEYRSFVKLTADIPLRTGIGAEEILLKIEELRKRSVEQWIIQDSGAQRRKRFLKHLQ